MSAPNIKIHLVPDGYNPSLDTGSPYQGRDLKIINGSSPVEERTCRLIEKATNDRWTATGSFARKNLIKLIQDSGDVTGKTFIIDYAVEKTGYTDFLTKCNWIYCADPIISTTHTEEEWVMDHGEYSIGEGVIEHLHHQIFIDKTSNFVGVLGNSPNNITLDYTFIPQIGAYSFNYNDFSKTAAAHDTMANLFEFVGDITPVHQTFDTNINEWKWDGPVHYKHVYESGVNKIIFSDEMFKKNIKKNSNPSDLTPNDVYFRGHVYRTNNSHSSSSFGIVATEGVSYYAFQHDDIVAQVTPALRRLDASNNVLTIPPASYHWDQGIVGFSYPSYPATGDKVYLDTYTYHSWMRLSNDMTGDLLFRTYTQDTLSKIEIFNADDASDPSGNKGQVNNFTTGQIQTQQQTVNYTWTDIKITNEAAVNITDPPNLMDFYIDATPRGILGGGQDDEQISYGRSGLLYENRPWDHQEGARVETDKVCFIRAVVDYAKLYDKPNDHNIGYPDVLYANPMRQMNAAQAWQIKKWYNSTYSSGGSGKRFLISLSNDDIMSENQVGSALTMYSGDIIYGRIVHMLWDGTTKVPVASAPKYWTISIKGDYLT